MMIPIISPVRLALPLDPPGDTWEAPYPRCAAKGGGAIILADGGGGGVSGRGAGGGTGGPCDGDGGRGCPAPWEPEPLPTGPRLSAADSVDTFSPQFVQKELPSSSGRPQLAQNIGLSPSDNIARFPMISA